MGDSLPSRSKLFYPIHYSLILGGDSSNGKCKLEVITRLLESFAAPISRRLITNFYTSVTQAICINARGHAELHALPGSYCSAWESSITFTLIVHAYDLKND
jgi:hypothetical protein